MIPARYAPILFGLILSGLMSCMVSGITTLRATGLGAGVFTLWIGAWMTSWAIAFPAVLLVAPLTRRLVSKPVRQERTRTESGPITASRL